MGSLDHGLFGFSQGATFVGYTLFTQPAAFARYSCGSPALNSSNHWIFRPEEEYAAKNGDLPLSLKTLWSRSNLAGEANAPHPLTKPGASPAEAALSSGQVEREENVARFSEVRADGPDPREQRGPQSA